MNTSGYLIYLRVSTTKQEEEGYGLDTQEAACRYYAKRNALPLLEPLIADDVSGDTVEREGLDKVKELLRTGVARGVIIHRPDRLARKSWIGLQALEQIHSWGKEVHFENLGLIPNSPEGRFNVAIHFAVGELDKAKLLNNLHNARREKVTKYGLTLNAGRPPYGFSFAGAKKASSYQHIEQEAETVRLIYRLFRETRSLAAVAKYLTQHRIPTYEDLYARPGKRSSKQRRYGEWSTAVVLRILKHPIYKGKAPYFATYRSVSANGKPVQRRRSYDDPAVVWVDVPPIVSEEEWEAAQCIIAEQERRPHNRFGEYLLSGRISCRLSGYRAVGKVYRGQDLGRNSPKKTSLFYYLCSNKGHRGRAVRSCDLPMFRQEAVEQAVWLYVENHLLDPVGLALGLQNLHASREQEHDALEEQRQRLQRQLVEIQARQDRLIHLYLDGIYKEGELTGHKQQLDRLQQSVQDKLAEVEEQLACLTATERDVRFLTEFAALVREKLDSTQFEHRREILRILGVQVDLAVEGGEKVLYITSHLTADTSSRLLVSANEQSLW